MERDSRLRLLRLANDPPEIIRERHPTVFAEVSGRVETRAKAYLRTTFPNLSGDLRTQLERLDLTLAEWPGGDPKEFLLGRLVEQGASPEIVSEAREALAELDEAGLVPTEEDLKRPIAELPLFELELEQARMAKLGELAGVPAAKVERLAAGVSSPTLLTAVQLDTLVQSGTLDRTEAEKLSLAAVLDRVTEGDEKLTSAVIAAPVGGDGAAPVRDFRDLARLSAGDWSAIMKNAKVRAPAGTDRETYARRLEERFTAAFPTDALLARVTPAGADSIRGALTQFQPILEANDQPFARPFDELDLPDMSAQQRAAARGAHEELTTLVNLHPGLRLDEVFTFAESVDRKLRVANRRLELVETVTRLNPETELLALDYRPDSPDLQALKLDGLDGEEQRLVLGDLKAYQRVFGITNDVSKSVTLLAAGYPTAVSIATTPFETFRATTGLTDADARAYYAEAKNVLADASTNLVAIADVTSGGLQLMNAAANVETETLAYLRKLEGYADLFGSQDYCRCEHCQSIFGSAAYFVDLMCFAEEEALGVFTGANASHPLNLKVRRPDLWTLELTCRNTDELIPTLDLINPILENAIAVARGFPESDLTDRAAVEDEVYRLAISTSVDSFRQPFVLPLEKLEIYLSHAKRSRAEVARALASPPDVHAAAVLGLSRREYELITQPDATTAFLTRVYGFAFVTGSGGAVDPIDVQELLRFTGLSRDDFGDLLATRYVTANGTDPVEIRAEKRSPDSLQNDVERVHELTLAALDRFHRLTRLWRKLGWPVGELDLAVTHLASAGIASDLDEAGVQQLATIEELRQRFALSVEDSLSLWSDLPTASAAVSRPPLLDRLFNLAPFVAADGPFPDATVSFVHPALRDSGTPLPSDNTLNRLLAGLRLSEEQLCDLIAALEAPLGATLTALNQDDRGFALSLHNLALLYRHAMLARLLGLSIADLHQLLELVALPGGHVATLADVLRLVSFHDWLEESGFALDDLGFIIQGRVRDPDAYPDAPALAAELVGNVAEERALEFADTIFAFLPGVTEDQSRAIVAANAGAIVSTPSGGALRLSNAFDPTAALTIPAGIGAAEPDVRALVTQYHAATVLPLRIATLLGVTAEHAAELLAMTGADLSAASLVDALWGGPIGPIETLIAPAARLALLLGADSYDVPALAFVRANPGIFEITDFNAVDVDAIRKLSVYAALTDPARTPANAPEGTEPDPAAVRAVLAAFEPITKFDAAPDGQLAAALLADPVLLAGLLPNLDLPATAPEALAMVREAAALASAIGIGGEALRLIVSDDYADLARASDAVLSAIQGLYRDEEEFADQLEPLLDRLRSRRRDALVDYLIRSAAPPFDSQRDLYAYYLLDTELEGCARTSRLVAAISSVQLYITRCLLNLEQDDLPASDPVHIRVELDEDAIAEWTWRKNYRVWEANRKVFLYPENYIEPELRDDKTPLCEDVESTLLQQRITEQNVLDAYAGYLSGFEEVARLKIAGSYHDIGATEDTLHLFGVMPGDPPVYYYRTIQNAYHGERGGHRAPTYTPWRKIDVQIPGRRVSPLVFQGRLFVFWVEITTTPVNTVTAAGSQFAGYKHKLMLRFTSLRLDGTWTAPQALTPALQGRFAGGEGVVLDPLVGGVPKYDTKVHAEPIDGYTLSGFQWESVYPNASGRVDLTLRNFAARAPVDFYRKLLTPVGGAARKHFAIDGQVLCSRSDGGQRHLYYGLQTKFSLDDYAQCVAVADERRLDRLNNSTETSGLFPCLSRGLYQQAMARLGGADEIDVVNGAVTDAIIDSNGDLLLLQGSVRPGRDYLLKRLGTTLTEQLVRTLFMSGVHGLLATDTQKALQEAPLPISLLTGIHDESNAGKLDFRGPYGTYYREIFFHIPALIANHLNSQQRFAAAQQWYHFIFDPTSTETIVLPPGLTPEEQEQKLRNRVWRYLEFRGLNVPKLQEVLGDPAAIEVYRKDPFNPHAIARLRLTAYQQNIVMKYVDNLLDWADSLFTEFTTESLNEATLLYVMAAEILGPRPAALGECGEEAVQPRTYETIGPLLKQGHGFLGEVETYTLAGHSRIRSRSTVKGGLDYLLTGNGTTNGASDNVLAVRTAEPKTGIAKPYSWYGTWIGAWQPKNGVIAQVDEIDSPLVKDGTKGAGFAWSIARQFVPAFCIPPNKDLLGYWDRVENRLYKLRHCLDINGVFRRPPLFAPEIDPRLLVRARAAGLSLEDVLNATSGNLPPYRFTYLIERAKAAVAAVQTFGAALLSALEKKDLEELSKLRTVHQQNLLRMTSRLREWEITIASDAIAQLERQQAAVEYRRGYYEGLVTRGLTRWETAQQVSRHLASGLQAGAGLLDTVAGILYLIPQIGSPFAMKYGGQETGNSANAWAMVARDAAHVAEAVSASAGLEGGFERREEGWRHQIDLAAHELEQIEKQLSAARLRKEIAVRSRDIHLETMNQMDELIEFYGERFGTLGRYTLLSTTLQRVYREAYNGAYEMARLAEQAYRFERNDEAAPLLAFDYWEATNAGLLAGERLAVDIQNMERRFIETNYRRLELDQAFSLTQIDPAALVELRETGSCEFEIPELYFDLFYPGQYGRRITSARVTIPCITGPYTNVSATLTLTGSRIRRTPALGAANLTDVPPRRSTSIATSTAQNDAGVFEFSFRDERYMPFEGAGAISSWRLTLPRNFRQFDYQTMSDVIMHLSYTADYDGVLADAIEQQNAALEGTLLNVLSNEPLARLFSLRQDFSGAFNQLLHSPEDTNVNVEISERYLPVFLRGRTIEVTRAKLALKVTPGESISGFSLRLDGASQSGFAADTTLGDLPAKDVTATFAGGLVGTHTFSVENAGDLAPAPVPGDPSALDDDTLLDVQLYVEVQVQ